MPWNTPGSGPGNGGDDNGRRGNWKPRGGEGRLDGLWQRLKDGGLGGSGPGAMLRWFLLGVLLAIAASSFTLVGEQERGVVLRFGQFARIMQPGPNLKWPWPIEAVTKVKTTTVNTFGNTVPVLTNDENIVSVTMNVQYVVRDPRLYLYGSTDAGIILGQAAQSAVREQVGRASLEDVLNRRGPLASAAKTRLQQALDEYRTGLAVTELTLPNARPPDEVKPAFDEVNGAQQERERLVNEAEAYAAKVVPEARGTAARTRADAEGYKESVVARAQGDAERFSLLQKEYAKAPEVTRKRLWLETAERVLAHNRTVVGADGRQLIYVPMPAAAPPPAPAAATAGPPVDPITLPGLLPQVQATPTPGASDGLVRPQRPAGREESTR